MTFTQLLTIKLCNILLLVVKTFKTQLQLQTRIMSAYKIPIREHVFFLECKSPLKIRTLP